MRSGAKRGALAGEGSTRAQRGLVMLRLFETLGRGRGTIATLARAYTRATRVGFRRTPRQLVTSPRPRTQEPESHLQ